MYGLFWGATTFNRNLGAWDTSKVENMMRMFDRARSFDNEGSNSIGTWTVSSVIKMNLMLFLVFRITHLE